MFNWMYGTTWQVNWWHCLGCLTGGVLGHGDSSEAAAHVAATGHTVACTWGTRRDIYPMRNTAADPATGSILPGIGELVPFAPSPAARTQDG